MTNQQIWSSRCWTCLKAQQDPSEKYICPQVPQHWKEYQKQLIKKTAGEKIKTYG